MRGAELIQTTLHDLNSVAFIGEADGQLPFEAVPDRE